MSPLQSISKTAWRRLRRSWRALREWCDDAAYERYLQSRAYKDGRNGRLTAKAFYLERLNRRYSQPNRCC